MFCLFLYWFPIWQYVNVSLSEKTEAVCVTPHTSLHSGKSLRAVVTQMVLCTGSSSCPQDWGQVCVCSSRGISMAGSNLISMPDLSAAGVDSKNSASPDSSCCCLVLKHKWLIANLVPRQEQSAKLLFIGLFLCATSPSFLLSVRGGSWFCLCYITLDFLLPVFQCLLLPQEMPRLPVLHKLQQNGLWRARNGNR